MPSRGWALDYGKGGISSQLPAPIYSVARSNFRNPKRWADNCGAEPGMLEFPQSLLYIRPVCLGKREISCYSQTVHRPSKGRNS